MAHKKSASGMSGGTQLSGLRDVQIPANPVTGGALSLTPTGEFTILEYSQDYFTARALEVIPPMGAVKLGPGGVLPRTSSEEPSSPVIGVSVAGAGAGEDVVVLRSGKIAGKVFSPENSILRTLVDGTVGVAAAGTIVGTVDEAGVGYVSIGSASSGGGGGSASVSAEPGNIISEKPDGLYAAMLVSDDPANAAELRSDGIFVEGGYRIYNPGDVYTGIKGLEHPALLSMSAYNTLEKAEHPEVLTAQGNWWYKYLQEEAIVSLPPMTANNLPAPLIAAASSAYQATLACAAFDGITDTDKFVWHSNSGANQWISLDFGKEYAMQQFGWYNREYQPPVGNPTSVVLALTNGAGEAVHTQTYTGFGTAVLNKSYFPLLPGTTTDEGATIGIVKNVQKMRITVPASQYVITREIPLILYDNSKVPDTTTQFVTPKQVHPDPQKDYYIVLSPVKVNQDGSISGGVKEVTVSPDIGNTAEMRGNGLYVAAVGGSGSVSVSAEPGNIISKKPDGLYAGGSAGGTYDLVDNTIVKMPFKLNGKQVYAYRFNYGVGPASGTVNKALPAAIPAMSFAWLDPTTTMFVRIGHAAAYADTFPMTGSAWIAMLNYIERFIQISMNTPMNNTNFVATILFTRVGE